MENNFTEEDVKKLIEFLNTVSEKAEFKMSTQDIIRYFGLLSHMQKSIVPKIQKHVLEVIAVHDAEGEGEE
jgi:hypothetical protein